MTFAAAAAVLIGLAAASQAGGSPAAGGGPAADPAAPSPRWAVVEDDTLGVRPEEAELYGRVLVETAAANPGRLALDAAEFAAARRRGDGAGLPPFVDLFRHPDAYRGKAVTLTGHARVVREFPGPAPRGGGDPPTLVEAWVFTEDSQTNPAVVVAADAPDLPRWAFVLGAIGVAATTVILLLG